MFARFFRWYFGEPAELRPWGDIISWWEARRIPYNLIVGLAGSVSLLFFFLFIELAHGLRSGEDAVEPMALFAAPFLINIAYTAGWVVELLLRPLCRHKSSAIAPALMKLGVAFSLFVAFIPTIIWCIIWIVRSL